MPIGSDSTSHIETKVFGIQYTDMPSLIWIFSYTYLFHSHELHDVDAFM